MQCHAMPGDVSNAQGRILVHNGGVGKPRHLAVVHTHSLSTHKFRLPVTWAVAPVYRASMLLLLPKTVPDAACVRP